MLSLQGTVLNLRPCTLVWSESLSLNVNVITSKKGVNESIMQVEKSPHSTSSLYLELPIKKLQMSLSSKKKKEVELLWEALKGPLLCAVVGSHE